MSVLISKLWGYEKILVNNDLYCGKILTVLPNGNACSIHYHKNKKETFHILRGTLFLQTFDPAAHDSPPCLYVLRVGEAATLEPTVPHRFWTMEEICEFVEVSTHDDPSDSYRIQESGPIPKPELYN